MENTVNSATVNDLKNFCRRWGRNKNRVPDLVDIDEWSPGKDGRMDMLTLDLKTWLIRGFEIKMSRADFLADRKWGGYLPFVNYFWFVVPQEGIIKLEELPADIGLLIFGQWPSRGSYNDNLFPGLKEIRKAKNLQPRLVRMSYGELRMTQLLLKLLRSRQWRSQSQQQNYSARIYTQIDEFLYRLDFPGRELIAGRISHIIHNSQ